MTLIAFILTLLSAITHASWNLLSKRENPSTVFFLLANAAGVLLLLPSLFLFSGFLSVFPRSIWFLVAVSGLFQAIYFTSLGKSYHLGEMSVIYPLVRTVPVLMIAVLSLIIGQSRLNPLFFCGVVLIIAGALILPVKKIREVRYYPYLSPLMLFAAGAATGTIGYTLTDSQALSNLRMASSVTSIFDEWQFTLVYWCLESLATSFWLALCFFMFKQSVPVSFRLDRTNLIYIFLVGVQITFTYFLVLVAMNHVCNVSYVAALRQVSIPLGVLLGILVLKESITKPKIAGSLMIFSGIVIVSLV